MESYKQEWSSQEFSRNELSMGLLQISKEQPQSPYVMSAEETTYLELKHKFLSPITSQQNYINFSKPEHV